jgi:uncharacterized protein YidB (DUF937 family)
MIRQNRYNDPALGQAFNNIASLFAPPSAGDLANYAQANARREEAERLAWLFGNPTDPTASARAALTGVQSYANTPSGFYRTDETTRRGQDIDSGDRRYGIDVGSQTTLATNAADNDRARDVARMGGQVDLASQFMSPLNPGQVQPGLPEGIAYNFGLPEFPRTAGLPPVLSETEQQAAERQALIASGMLTPDLQLESILGQQTPVTVVGEGGAPTFMSPGAAVRQGAQAFQNQGSQAAPQVANYRTPAGDVGTAQFSEGQWRDTQTGQPVPPGSQTFSATTTGGVNDALGATTSNRSQAQRVRADVQSMSMLVNELENTIRGQVGTAGMAANLQSFVQDLRQVGAELSAALGDNPNAPVSEEQFSAITQSVLGAGTNYDPAFRRVRAMLLDLAYMNARMNNPSGEVSRFALERELEALGLGGVANDQSVLASLAVSRQRMERALSAADVLEGSQPGPTPSDVQRPGAQPAAPPPAGAGRVRYDANGNRIP